MSAQFEENQFKFQAWMEPNGPDGKLKLHVHGEVHVKDETLLYQLDKKIPQGYYPEELFLVIKPDPTQGESRVSIKYHEDVDNKDKYNKVTIMTQTEQVFEINELQVKNNNN